MSDVKVNIHNDGGKVIRMFFKKNTPVSRKALGPVSYFESIPYNPISINKSLKKHFESYIGRDLTHYDYTSRIYWDDWTGPYGYFDFYIKEEIITRININTFIDSFMKEWLNSNGFNVTNSKKTITKIHFDPEGHKFEYFI